MTNKQEVNQPVAVKSSIDGVYRPKFYSDEALKALHIRPHRTVWGYEDGRPIYNRLPAIEEGYQVGYDFDQPRVYIDPAKNWAKGIGTIEVARDRAKPATLNIASGTITWREGFIDVESLTVDTNEFNDDFGLPVGFYQVAYQILPFEEVSETPIPGYAEVNVEDSSISDAYVLFNASSEAAGHYDYYVIDTVETTASWRPNVKGETGGYDTGSEYVLNFGAPVRTEKLTVKAESIRLSTASAALYTSDNGIIWNLQDEKGSENGSWSFEISSWYNQYVRTFFWDGKASINEFSFTGSLYIEDRRVRENESVAALVIQDMYESIEGEYLTLATFEVRNVGSIVNVKDLRSVSYHKHQPVASWLTQFQDDNLRCLFDSVTRYSYLSMAPQSSSIHLYEEMIDSNCFGLGELDLGDQMGAPRLKLPTIVEITSGEVKPKAVDLLADPTEESSLTNRAYANYQLYESWSLDNGNY